MRGQEASKLILEWGTPSFAQRFPKAPEAAMSATGQPHLPRTAQLSATELTPLLMEKRAALEKRIAKGRRKELTPPQTQRRRGRGHKRSAAANGGAPKRPRADATATLTSARWKLARARFNVEVAVMGDGGARRRADCLSVPELKALVADRGWKLPRGTPVNQGTLLALALAQRDEARNAAATASGRPDDPMSDDGEEECWGHRAGDYEPIARAPAGEKTGTEQQAQQPSGRASGLNAGADAHLSNGDDDEGEPINDDGEPDDALEDEDDDVDGHEDGDDDDNDVVDELDDNVHGLGEDNDATSSSSDDASEDEHDDASMEPPEHASSSSSSDDD